MKVTSLESTHEVAHTPSFDSQIMNWVFRPAIILVASMILHALVNNSFAAVVT